MPLYEEVDEDARGKEIGIGIDLTHCLSTSSADCCNTIKIHKCSVKNGNGDPIAELTAPAHGNLCDAQCENVPLSVFSMIDFSKMTMSSCPDEVMQ